MSPGELICKINDIIKIQTHNMFDMKDICFDYKKADLLSILYEKPIEPLLNKLEL